MARAAKALSHSNSHDTMSRVWWLPHLHLPQQCLISTRMAPVVVAAAAVLVEVILDIADSLDNSNNTGIPKEAVLAINRGTGRDRDLGPNSLTLRVVAEAGATAEAAVVVVGMAAVVDTMAAVEVAAIRRVRVIMRAGDIGLKHTPIRVDLHGVQISSYGAGSSL